MTLLVLGASGATGRLLTENLLMRGARVKAIVRSKNRLPARLRDHKNLTVIEASVNDLTEKEIQTISEGCTAILSCLGHNLTFRGMFWFPRRLVTRASRRFTAAAIASAPTEPVKYILMGSSGVRNPELKEKVSCAHILVISLLRLLLPPHVDNEKAARHLRRRIGAGHAALEWAVVRPDGLVNEDHITGYDIHRSPLRDAIFNAGKTSRINVADFMADLAVNERLWENWRGKMPVIYNRDQG